tara:strand:- start:2399 stop:2710 length:312 start_codon:yes stop_codon:yes gene_type:complete
MQRLRKTTGRAAEYLSNKSLEVCVSGSSFAIILPEVKHITQNPNYKPAPPGVEEAIFLPLGTMLLCLGIGTHLLYHCTKKEGFKTVRNINYGLALACYAKGLF